jgi:riboflavin synthase
MFTGIVEELGEVAELIDLGDAARIAVRGKTVTVDARHGDSIAVNGVCLTVVNVDGETFTADVMAETLNRSSLGALAPGDAVNLERAAMLSTRLGGHLVQGHVDGVATIVSRQSPTLAEAAGVAQSPTLAEAAGVAQPAEQWEVVTFTLPPTVGRYVVEKGSITVDGVSLTVTAVTDDTFSVSLIPTTLALTTLGRKGIGDPVNLEVDVIAKYVEKLLGGREGPINGLGTPEGRE